MFEFILFVLIGLCLFLPMSERAKTAALVFYVVIMAIWLLIGGPRHPRSGQYPPWRAGQE